MRASDYDAINQKIIAQLNEGVRPWVKSHNSAGGGMPLRACGTPYRGMNTIMLWMAEYDNPYWLTFNKIKSLGGSVKGEKSPAKVIYASQVNKEREDGSKESFGFRKLTSVFNASQVTGLPDHYYTKENIFSNADERANEIDAWVAHTGADISAKDTTPCYVPAIDKIYMPHWEDWKDANAYYSTLFHELTHWTGSSKRLDRLDMKNRKGYAFEELVAEISAAYLMANLGLSLTVRDDHSEYIGAWLSALDDDHKYIFDAASAAQKAVDYLFEVVAVSQNTNVKTA